MRTEEQKIIQEPIQWKIGDTTHSIPLLKIKQSKLWKQEWWDAISGSGGYKETVQKIENLRKTEASAEEMQEVLSKGFHTLLIGQSDIVIDLVVSYIKMSGCELTRETIEDEATEADVAVLWEQINEVAFPLVTSLANAMSKKR